MNRIAHILILLAAFAAIWGVQIENRTEAEDSYEYAFQAELGEDGWIYHPHHLLYGALAKDFYSGLRYSGYSGRAHAPLRLLSSICAAVSVLMFYLICRCRLKLNPVGSLTAAFTLLFCYGFWRYGNEVEIIAPASLAVMLTFYLAGRTNQTTTDAIIAGIVGVMAIAIHLLNAIPVLVAIPCIYILRRNWRLMAVYLGCATVLSLSAYAAVYYFESGSILTASAPTAEFSLSAIPKGALAMLHNLVSSNFIFGFAEVREVLPKMFPARMLGEELWMGANMPKWIAVFGAVSAILIAATALTSIVMALKTRRGEDADSNLEKRDTARPTLVAAVVWLVVYALAIILSEPSNPEVWTMALIPLMIIFAALIVAPLSSDTRLWPVALLAILLALHNYFAGLYPLQDPQGDFNRVKSQWLLENSSNSDIIVTAGNPVFMRYLRYYSGAPVAYLYDWSDSQLEQAEHSLLALAGQLDRGGRIFIMSDVFEQPASLRKRFPDRTASIDSFSKIAARHARLIRSDILGDIYLLAIPSGKVLD